MIFKHFGKKILEEPWSSILCCQFSCNMCSRKTICTEI